MELHKERYNVLICGTLSSGSSALHNLLKEYDNVGHFLDEFDDFRAPGLVADQLSYNSSLSYPNKIDAVTRINSFRKRLIYKSLIWKLFLNIIPKKYFEIDYNVKIVENLKNRIIRLNQVFLLKQLNKSLESNLPFEEKIQISRNWIQHNNNIFSTNKCFIMYDQPILKTTDIDIWTTVFNPYKLIIVYRDPRDQLADIIKRGQLYPLNGTPYMTLAGINIDSVYGKDRRGAMKFHIDAISNRLKWIEYLECKLNKDRILVCDFEGLVNHHEEYKTKLEDFIGVTKENHKFKNKYFDPVKSKENIGIYKNYLNEDELKYLSDLVDWYFKKVENPKGILKNDLSTQFK